MTEAEKVAGWVAVCSAKPRPSVQTNRSKFGNQWWARDVYHLKGVGDKTICGRDCSEWLTVGPIVELSPDCCSRCSAKALAVRDILRAKEADR